MQTGCRSGYGYGKPRDAARALLIVQYLVRWWIKVSHGEASNIAATSIAAPSLIRVITGDIKYLFVGKIRSGIQMSGHDVPCEVGELS